MEARYQVLVVDGEREVVDMIALALGSEDLEVRTAFDGLSALDALAESRPDLILLDAMIPVMDGFEVCRRVKSDPKTRDVPVVLFTGAEAGYTLGRLAEAGADDYITKPIDSLVLEQRIRKILADAKK